MFFDKLNKKEEGYHSIKETVTIKSGVYEGILRHDNVNPDSIMIVDSSGKSVDNYMLSTPEDKSWETHIKIFHDKDGEVDIFYETPGDIVDADDINKIQDYLIELSNQGGGSGEIPQEEIDAIIKQIETIKNNKADKEHTHSADDIRETFSKNFVSMADKLKIQDINDKADKTDIPKMVSELENDVGYITIDEIPEGGGGGTSGVSSVNGKSGRVILTGEDIKATSGLFKPSVAEELDRLDSNIDKKADKNETQKQLDTKVEMINNVGGKHVKLYGNFIDTEWGSGKSITDAIKEKADKDSVVTSVNGQTGDVVVEGGISKVNSVNGQTGDVVLDGSNINVELEVSVDVIAITTTNIGGYGYIDSVVDTDSIKDKDLLLWDLSDMTNEDPFVKLDIYTSAGDRLVSSANIKNEHNLSLRQNELYGYDNVLLEYQADNGNLHVQEYNAAPKGIEVKRLNDAINNKVDVDQVVTSVNGQKGDVVIEGGSGGLEYVIPRQTNTPKNKEIYVKDIHTKPFEVVVDRVSEGIEQKETEFIVSDIDGYANVYLSIINGEGELTIYFKDTTNYYSYTHQKANGDRDSSGWIKGDKDVVLNVGTGDVISMSTSSNLIFGYKPPKDMLTYELFFEGEPITKEFDATPILEDIGHIKRDIGYKADKTDIPTKVSQLDNDKGYITLDEIPSGGGNGGGVTSINGETGNVELDANKIPYSKWSTVKDELDFKVNTWDLLDYAKKDDVVTSVNGQKGDVIIEGGSGGGGSARSSTIVIANYDSHENSKKSADIVIDKGENAAKKINDAIQSLKGTGGEVKLMEGNYNLEYGIAVNVDGVHLTGIPDATILVQNRSWKDNPYNGGSRHIVDTKSDIDNLKVTISNLCVQGIKSEFNHGFNCEGSSTIKNCISENSGWCGFDCNDLSTINSCISKNSSMEGFHCKSHATINNCISDNSGTSGFYCNEKFKGVCTFNILKGDTLNDDSSAPAIVEYNIIQEG